MYCLVNSPPWQGGKGHSVLFLSSCSGTGCLCSVWPKEQHSAVNTCCSGGGEQAGGSAFSPYSTRGTSSAFRKMTKKSAAHSPRRFGRCFVGVINTKRSPTSIILLRNLKRIGFYLENGFRAKYEDGDSSLWGFYEHLSAEECGLFTTKDIWYERGATALGHFTSLLAILKIFRPPQVILRSPPTTVITTHWVIFTHHRPP